MLILDITNWLSEMQKEVFRKSGQLRLKPLISGF
jgi:hypothetical protein